MEGKQNDDDTPGAASSGDGGGDDDDNNNINNNNKRKKSSTAVASSCPYLDSIDRTALDFDLEQSCAVTLQTGSHIYVCLVCGGYLRGRGPRTPAYTHSVQKGHYVFCHLATSTFYCLPDDYEIGVEDMGSLQDIQRALHPVFVPELLPTLGTTLSRDLFGRYYRPGFVGLQNLQGTDHMNATLQALAHVIPLRDYFLADHYAVSSTTKHPTALAVTTAFADVIRKLWSPWRFRSHVDPHVFAHVAKPQNMREVGDFLAWLLHQLHLGTKVKKHQKSIIEQVFQGRIKVTTRETQRSRQDARPNHGDDERYGSGDDEEADGPENNANQQQPDDHPTLVVAETTVAETTFFSLSVDIPEKPLFRDEEGGLVIPQEALVNALQKKFDGQRFVDVTSTTRGNKGGKAQRRQYQIQALPDHLILHLIRFRDQEKNPTIIVFPVKNLDLHQYLGEQQRPPTEDTIRAMGIGELKRCLAQYNGGRTSYHVVEKKDLVEAAIDATCCKYDLVANISHDSPVEVGREDGGKVDQLHEGTYKCHVKADKQWFEIQDLHVKEVMAQQIGVSESCVLIFARHRRSSS
jgi:U4/U6.U5 tri-snRNP-associated protein 2